jgi:hypothetical protein
LVLAREAVDEIQVTVFLLNLFELGKINKLVVTSNKLTYKIAGLV